MGPVPWWLVAGPVNDVFGAVYEIREILRQDHHLNIKMEEYLDKVLVTSLQNKELLTKIEDHMNTAAVEVVRMRQIFEIIRDESRLR